MAIEIELKIRLDDPDTFRKRMGTLARLEGPYHKIDTYFHGGKGSFRLRETGGAFFVCRKEKAIEGGVEVNSEIEFGVDGAQAFRSFAESLGYREWYRKEKRGEVWRWDEVMIEVGTVSDLGWFAEFELLLSESVDRRAVDQARQRLLDVLDALQISPDRVEHQTYSQLLGHRGR